MASRVLFIDDDKALLNTLERNLSFDFEITTAEGCDEAIMAVDSLGPFSVIVVDMRMPKYDGIQTITALRQRSPESVYIMLTGNQDVSTAMQAVNEGQVFRFLCKPCEMDLIHRAISDAQRQHNMEIAERELLQGTFVGAIDLMTDIIELQGCRLIDTNRMAETISDLAQQLSIELGWEERVAARIFLVGISLLDQKQLEAFDSMDATTPEHQSIVAKICKTSSSMIDKIPRLSWIAKTLKLVPHAEGWTSLTQRDEIASTLLRVAFYWNLLTLKGLSVPTTRAMIKRIIPDLSECIEYAMCNLNDNRDAHTLTKLPVSELREGMVLFADVLNNRNDIVVSRGRPLTQSMIDNIARIPELAESKIPIISNSCPALSAS